MHSKTILVGVFGFATLAKAHMKMATPVPYGQSTLNNSPLDAKGADFPCKQRTGVYDAEGASNTMALGSVQPLTFVGQAVHGGGSCQISVTYDKEPTASSTFKVIHSIEGGCPAKNQAGNEGDSASATDPDTYSFTVPTTLPTGTATLAWTWFNRIGNREMYMNCAPITITAAASKRSDEDELMARNYTQIAERDAAFSALPDMFVANIPASSCTNKETFDTQFPSPGDSVERFGSFSLALPSGPSCGASVAAAAATASSSSQATAAPAVSGGVFASISSSAAPQATSTSVASPASPVVASSATPSVVSSAAPVSTGTGTTGTGTAIAAGTACTTEGMWNCIGGTSFQQCASGVWSAVQQVAAGTDCSSGQTMALNIAAIAKPKRSVRFSGAHIRRHLQSS